MNNKIIIGLFVIICGLFLTACSKDNLAINKEIKDSALENTDVGGKEFEVELENVLEDQEDECVEPPRVLIIDTYEEIHALKDLIDEPDEMVVQEYLKKAYIIDNGLDTKADIIHFFEKIEEVEMPYFEINDAWKLKHVMYYPETVVVEVVYRDGEEIIRFFGSWERPENFSEEYSGENKVAINAGDKEVNLRFSSEEKPWVIGKIQTSNSYVIMRYRAEDKERIEDKMAVADIKIAPMGKVIEKIMEKEYWAED